MRARRHLSIFTCAGMADSHAASVSAIYRRDQRGSQCSQATPDPRRLRETSALVGGSPSDSPIPAQTPCPCLGVKRGVESANSSGQLRDPLDKRAKVIGKIAFLALTTCSNVTRALTAAVDAALGKGDKGDSVECTIGTPDGRMLAVEESGDPAGRPVLVHTGTPGSRHLYGPIVRDAAARGLRLISYDRPGYGGSSPQPGRTVATAPGMSARSALSLASIGWRCGACPAAARTCSRALPCSRT